MYSANPGKVNSLSRLTDSFPQILQNTFTHNGMPIASPPHVPHVTCHFLNSTAWRHQSAQDSQDSKTRDRPGTR